MICCYADPFLFQAEGDRRVTGNPKRILLTGGAGFIGSHVAEALLRNHAQLSIVDNLDEFYSPTWKKSNLESIRKIAPFDFFEQDICAMDRLRETVANVRPHIIIHLAARAGVRPSIEQPRLYEQVNVAGTVNLLELCREFHVSRLIFGSSSSVYGESSRAPFSEEQSDLRPISPYAATKLAGELFCYTYAHLYKLPVMALRFFTVYGPSCSGLTSPFTNSSLASRREDRSPFSAMEKRDGITPTWMTLSQASSARSITISLRRTGRPLKSAISATLIR